MNLVTMRDVSVAYDGYEALQHVDLKIGGNDFLGVIGPNGGGKTTLVKAILGTVPHTGEIRLAPELFRDKERLIGYMPQLSDFDRTFPISVLEVVLSGLQGRRGFRSPYTREDREKAMELLVSSGIAETARNPIGEVSGGQMQRALLARAVISDPKLLILDEPANFVDNKFEKELYCTLHELNTRMAIVMVSHDIGTITSVVKEIVCVNRHVHRHRSNVLTEEQLRNYDCPIQLVSHGHIPHTVLEHHPGDGCCCDRE
ncbi:metal ABC transporter ATP-binding protein [Alistipes timonensis]